MWARFLPPSPGELPCGWWRRTWRGTRVRGTSAAPSELRSSGRPRGSGVATRGARAAASSRSRPCWELAPPHPHRCSGPAQVDHPQHTPSATAGPRLVAAGEAARSRRRRRAPAAGGGRVRRRPARRRQLVGPRLRPAAATTIGVASARPRP
jgi:hypothetical protein